ncbi:hypothetical protein OG528_38045 [Streptomyces platensis]|uniref:hypothetical protein n=1 Tax=Streptomyces platensis TaxID=58346 RepID=UPI0030DEF142
MDNRSTDRTAPATQPARIARHALVGREAEIELMPLDRADEAYRKMLAGKARFRMVLTAD